MNEIKTIDQIKKLLKDTRGIIPAHCDVCGTKYGNEDFHMVKAEGTQAVMHIKCPNCSNTYMVNIYSPVNGMIGSTRTQLNLDISDSEELLKFAGGEPVSSDSALEAYSLLTKQDVLESYFNKIEEKLKRKQSQLPVLKEVPKDKS